METLTKNVNFVAVDKLLTHERNPRRGDMNRIKNSIQANGFYGALVVQKSTKRILVGNHRYLAAKDLGYEKLPVIYVNVDDLTAQRMLLADNRTSDVATYDDEELIAILQEIETSELEGAGYNFDELEDMLEGMSDPEIEAESPSDTKDDGLGLDKPDEPEIEESEPIEGDADVTPKTSTAERVEPAVRERLFVLSIDQDARADRMFNDIKDTHELSTDEEALMYLFDMWETDVDG